MELNLNKVCDYHNGVSTDGSRLVGNENELIWLEDEKILENSTIC